MKGLLTVDETLKRVVLPISQTELSHDAQHLIDLIGNGALQIDVDDGSVYLKSIDSSQSEIDPSET